MKKQIVIFTLIFGMAGLLLVVLMLKNTALNTELEEARAKLIQTEDVHTDEALGAYIDRINKENAEKDSAKDNIETLLKDFMTEVYRAASIDGYGQASCIEEYLTDNGIKNYLEIMDGTQDYSNVNAEDIRALQKTTLDASFTFNDTKVYVSFNDDLQQADAVLIYDGSYDISSFDSISYIQGFFEFHVVKQDNEWLIDSIITRIVL